MKRSDEEKLAVYPGSFDPITYGHIDLIKRALKVFDRVIVAVADNPQKQHLFSLEERVQMVREVTGNDPRVEVDSFKGLLVDYIHSVGAKVIIRGLRAVSDFEYEFQMAHMNRRLCPSFDTFFMMTGEEHFYLSSKLVKEVVSLGGSVKGMVPETVEKRLIEKFASIRKKSRDS